MSRLIPAALAALHIATASPTMAQEAPTPTGAETVSGEIAEPTQTTQQRLAACLEHHGPLLTLPNGVTVEMKERGGVPGVVIVDQQNTYRDLENIGE